MGRVSLVGALLLLLESLFSVFKVYDKKSSFEFHWSRSVSVNSLFIYGVFLKTFLEDFALRSSLSFVFAFDDAILYP